MVDLRQKDGSIDEVEQWAGFLCELIGKFRNISFKSLNLDLNYFNFESFFSFYHFLQEICNANFLA